jgi:hypothetical protein
MLRAGGASGRTERSTGKHGPAGGSVTDIEDTLKDRHL